MKTTYRTVSDILRRSRHSICQSFFPAFDEGERLLFVYHTWCSNRSVCHAITLFGRHLGPAWHVLPRCHVFSFSRPGAGIFFVTLVGRWNVGDFLFTTGLFIVSQFSIKFFLYRKIFILIIGFVDVMITMCSAHCICFYEFKQDQLRSTRFNSITNYWTSFRFYKIFTALYLLLFVTIFEKYTRSWTVKRWPFYSTSSGCVVFWKQCYCESC